MSNSGAILILHKISLQILKKNKQRKIHKNNNEFEITKIIKFKKTKKNREKLRK